MVFTVLNETAKTCQVGYIYGSYDKIAIDRNVVNGAVTIPQTIEGYTVVKIGKFAFFNNDGIVSYGKALGPGSILVFEIEIGSCRKDRVRYRMRVRMGQCFCLREIRIGDLTGNAVRYFGSSIRGTFRGGFRSLGWKFRR